MVSGRSSGARGSRSQVKCALKVCICDNLKQFDKEVTKAAIMRNREKPCFPLELGTLA